MVHDGIVMHIFKTGHFLVLSHQEFKGFVNTTVGQNLASRHSIFSHTVKALFIPKYALPLLFGVFIGLGMEQKIKLLDHKLLILQMLLYFPVYIEHGEQHNDKRNDKKDPHIISPHYRSRIVVNSILFLMIFNAESSAKLRFASLTKLQSLRTRKTVFRQF